MEKKGKSFDMGRGSADVKMFRSQAMSWIPDRLLMKVLEH